MLNETSGRRKSVFRKPQFEAVEARTLLAANLLIDATAADLDRVQWDSFRGSSGRTDDGRWFFSRQIDTDQHELWVTDGTEDGTKILKVFGESRPTDDRPEREIPDREWWEELVGQLTVVGNHLFFRAPGGLWRSDGTPEGTMFLESSFHGKYKGLGTLEFDDLTLLRASGSNDGPDDPSVETWVVEADGALRRFPLAFPLESVKLKDGTRLAVNQRIDYLFSLGHEASTGLFEIDEDLKARKIADLPDFNRVQVEGSSFYTELPYELTPLGNEALFFSAADNTRTGYGIWRTNGTIGSAGMVKELPFEPRLSRNDDPITKPKMVGRTADSLVFTLTDDGPFWTSDGTSEGTRRRTEAFEFTPFEPAVVEAKVRLNLSEDGKSFHPSDLELPSFPISEKLIGHEPSQVKSNGNGIFFESSSTPVGHLDFSTMDLSTFVWSSSDDREFYPKDIEAPLPDAFREEEVVVFTHSDDLYLGTVEQNEDGSARLICCTQTMERVGNSITTIDGRHSLGTTTIDLSHLIVGRANGFSPALGGFKGRDDSRVIDTIDNKEITKFFDVGSGSWFLARSKYANSLYSVNLETFEATDLELDSVEAAVRWQDQIIIWRSVVRPQDRLDIVEKSEIWTTNGTAEGTRKLMETAVGNLVNRELRVSYAVAEDGVFFAYNDGTLRFTDGTVEGTRAIRSLGKAANVHSMQVLGNDLLFSAFTREHGQELWISDSTEDGTRLYQDIRPGPASSSPADLQVAVDKILFVADDGVHGREFWTYEPDPSSISDINQDGAVDYDDFLILSAQFGRESTGPASRDADINANGKVDFADFLILSGEFQT